MTATVQAVDAAAVAPLGGDDAPVRERPTIGPGTGFEAFEQTLLEIDTGHGVRRSAGGGEEVLFVLDGAGTLALRGARYMLEPESGALLAPGAEYELSAAGEQPLRLISVRIPGPASPDPPEPDPATNGPAIHERAVVRRVAEQESQAATTEREFRIVADPGIGLRSATHFVGYIPTARAPDHFHTYDEVIYVLDGEGTLHAEGTDWRLRAGSCIQLPARVVHCLENTGHDVMRVAAVFRPAGSPAAAYYPDGTPAHPAAPPLLTT